jgi:hypothetical protein
MEEAERTYIIECVNEVNDPETLWEISIVRIMKGPFASFDAAHTWMETIGAKTFNTLIIHILTPP